VGSGALVLLAGCLPLPFLIGRRLPPEWGRLLLWPAFIWMGLMFLLFVLLVGTDLVRLVAAVGARVASARPLDPDRRTMLARLVGGAAGLGAGLIGTAAVCAGAALGPGAGGRGPAAAAARASHGTTIVQLTDLHVGATIGRAFVEDIVRRTNALTPDLVAITGDLVDGPVERLRDAVAPLAGLRARHGVFFVTGNHEYFSGARSWLDELRRLGIRVLENERVAIGDGEGGFDLAGVHDYGASRFDADHRSDVGRALSGRDPAREVVLLAHQPRSVLEAARLGVGLQLSGHTHAVRSGRSPTGPPAAALHRRPAPARRHPDLRQPRDRLLGPAHAPRHPLRDHAHHAVGRGTLEGSLNPAREVLPG
jgi:hypothetical protein